MWPPQTTDWIRVYKYFIFGFAAELLAHLSSFYCMMMKNVKTSNSYLLFSISKRFSPSHLIGLIGGVWNIIFKVNAGVCVGSVYKEWTLEIGVRVFKQEEALNRFTFKVNRPVCFSIMWMLLNGLCLLCFFCALPNSNSI